MFFLPSFVINDESHPFGNFVVCGNAPSVCLISVVLTKQHGRYIESKLVATVKELLLLSRD